MDDQLASSARSDLIAEEKDAKDLRELQWSSIAAPITYREKAARKVERKVRKIVAAAVMKRRVGERFDAIVTGVNEHGTFTRILHPPVDGMIVRGERGLNVGEKDQRRTPLRQYLQRLHRL